jgi:hypothetical protein
MGNKLKSNTLLVIFDYQMISYFVRIRHNQRFFYSIFWVHYNLYQGCDRVFGLKLIRFEFGDIEKFKEAIAQLPPGWDQNKITE